MSPSLSSRRYAATAALTLCPKSSARLENVFENVFTQAETTAEPGVRGVAAHHFALCVEGGISMKGWRGDTRVRCLGISTASTTPLSIYSTHGQILKLNYLNSVIITFDLNNFFSVQK